MKRWLLVLLGLAVILSPLRAADGHADSDAFRSWSQGRPAESLPALVDRAKTIDSWQAWFDAGLCAHDAERPGLAVAALLRAHRLAPWQPEPRQALARLQAGPPPGWAVNLGPLAPLGEGPLALALAVLAGAGLAWAAVGRRRRIAGLVAGAVALALLLPGLIAREVDAGHRWAAIVEAVPLVDAAGKPLVELEAGTVVELAGDRWGGRMPVITLRGERGFVPGGLLAPSDDPERMPGGTGAAP